MRHIGILGGTFDPIHFGHILPALEIKSALNIDKIWLMPNHIPPHKKRKVTATEHRIEMVKLICDECSEFELCDIEVLRDTPSYTVETLEQLTEMFPDTHFTFLMGMDSLLSLNKWHQWQKMLELCDIAVSHRPGYNLPSNCEMAPIYKQYLSSAECITKGTSGRIFDIEIQPQNVSSTNIRLALNNQQLNNLPLPQTIIDYINQHQLYR